MKKKRILWIVYDFYQAGGQRYVYEICKALDKEKFKVDILKVAPHGYDENWDKEFYYHPSLDLGCHIYLLEDILKQGRDGKIEKFGLLSKAKKAYNKIASDNAHNGKQEKEKITTFLNSYDCINFSGLNVYKTLCHSNNLLPSNSFIHILTARFQDDKDIYEWFDKNRQYHFISSFSDDTLKSELIGFTNYKHTYYPLAFETTPYKVAIKEKKDEPFVIAVFTRLSSMKPLDPYFYALKLLKEKGVNVELRVYGAGDPGSLGLIRQLKYLYIADKVSFPGHVESLQDLIQTGNIDLLWFQSNNQLPAGYAALEIAMSALPQIFWDFADVGKKKSIGDVFPSFTSITNFVYYSEQLLNSLELRKILGNQQRNYVLEHNSNNKNIQILEALFDD